MLSGHQRWNADVAIHNPKRPIATAKAWPLKKTEKMKSIVFERKFLKEYFVLMTDEETGRRGDEKNNQLNCLLQEYDVLKTIKIRRLQ